ncbi:hypothetical protein OK074_4608 [Actinobacteria bacterium OK074]|nr:hypothetical protein OK074_4608 [Actinobacteria bacterium OK074]
MNEQPGPATSFAPRLSRRFGVASAWKITRFVMLFGLVWTFTAFILQMFPFSSSIDQLAADVRAGKVAVVYYDTDGQEVWVQWSSNLVVNRAATYQLAGDAPVSGDAVDSFEAEVGRRTGVTPSHVGFEQRDAADGMGGLGLLIPASYPFILDTLWLRVLAGVIGVAIIVRCLTGARHRLASGPAWLLCCVLTGFGFFAYLWAEPQSLVRPRVMASDRASRPPPGIVHIASRQFLARCLFWWDGCSGVLCAGWRGDGCFAGWDY